MTLRVCLAAFAMCAVLPLGAFAAPALTSASPSADSVAQGTPTVVELSFSEPVRLAACRIAVKGPDGKRADSNDLHLVGDTKHLAVSLKAELPGRYVVDWHVIAASAQRVAGTYGFTIAQ